MNTDVRNTIIHGDWIEAAKRWLDQSVHCVITSPPYWGQRDYGVEGQLGLEKTFEEHIEKLVVGFREIRRILRDDGVMFVNYGDKYAGGKCGGGSVFENGRGREETKRQHESGLPQGNLIGLAWRFALAMQADGWILRSDIIWAKAVSFNDKYSGSTMPESVNGTRWEQCRVKIKCGNRGKENQRKGANSERPQQDHDGKDFQPSAEYKDCPGCPKCEKNGGYVLRRGSWRPTRAHEYVFQFVKQIPYYCDMEAVREPHCDIARPKGFKGKDGIGERKNNAGWSGGNVSLDKHREYNPSGRNLRDVWTINPQPYPDAHYATFPEALIEPLIKVGTSQNGCCPKCGAAWARIIESQRSFQSGSGKSGNMPLGKNGPNLQGGGETLDVRRGPCVETQTIGWKPTCICNAGDPVPCVVYDPFTGSGTVLAVAIGLGRDYCGSELSKEYLEHQALKRIKAAETGLTRTEIERGQKALF